MTATAEIHEIGPATVVVAGYVEAVTADRVLGWAWAPAQPETRVTIELRLGDAIVARGVADQQRDDLAQSGIGDGRHAYRLSIPEEYRTRAAALAVFGKAGDGPAVRIGAPPRADSLSEQVTKLLHGVDTLLQSQRMLHRNLQAALTAKPETDAEPVAVMLGHIAEAQAGTTDQIAAVEQFVIRLDTHLSKLSQIAMERLPAVPRAAMWALGLAATALVISVAGLVHALIG